jgi:hypothetical protein
MDQRPTFADAVAHFQRIGFEVTPGPRHGEVTLILREEDSVSTTVWPQEMLQPIAEISRSFRYRNALLDMAAARPSL